MTDAEIIAAARILSPEVAATDRAEQGVFRIISGIAKESGRQLKIVTWPDGIKIMAIVDPTNRPERDALLIKSYREAILGHRGPIYLQEEQ
jgi:hypothetical protein